MLVVHIAGHGSNIGCETTWRTRATTPRRTWCALATGAMRWPRLARMSMFSTRRVDCIGSSRSATAATRGAKNTNGNLPSRRTHISRLRTCKIASSAELVEPPPGSSFPRWLESGLVVCGSFSKGLSVLAIAFLYARRTRGPLGERQVSTVAHVQSFSRRFARPGFESRSPLCPSV